MVTFRFDFILIYKENKKITGITSQIKEVASKKIVIQVDRKILLFVIRLTWKSQTSVMLLTRNYKSLVKLV